MAAGKPAAPLIRAQSWPRWLACLQTVLVTTVAIAFPAFSAVAASVFTLTNVALPGVAYSSVVCGDFNNDGKPDVLLTGADSSFNPICQFWQNRSSGLFSNLNAALPGLSSSAVALGDFDNDGRLDLFLTGFAGVDASSFPVYLSQVWHNLGNGNFTNVQAGLPGVNTGAVALGDFDNDGRLDILLTGYSSTGAVAQVWRNLGNGKFTNCNVGLPGVLYSSVAVGDYDNDGKLDILLAGVDIHTNSICQVWRNTGNWVFTNISAGLPGIHSGSLAWADFDNDGRLDLLLAGLDNTGNPMLQVYHNNTASSNASIPRLNGLKTLGNGGYQLSFGGQIGFGYRVWASTNLTQWTTLGAPNEGSPASFQFSDFSAPSLHSRFYRLTKP